MISRLIGNAMRSFEFQATYSVYLLIIQAMIIAMSILAQAAVWKGKIVRS